MMVIRSFQVHADSSPGDGHEEDPLQVQAAELFADQLAEQRVPSIRAIRAQLHVGQLRAQRLREYLATDAGRQAENSPRSGRVALVSQSWGKRSLAAWGMTQRPPMRSRHCERPTRGACSGSSAEPSDPRTLPHISSESWPSSTCPLRYPRPSRRVLTGCVRSTSRRCCVTTCTPSRVTRPGSSPSWHSGSGSSSSMAARSCSPTAREIRGPCRPPHLMRFTGGSAGPTGGRNAGPSSCAAGATGLSSPAAWPASSNGRERKGCSSGRGIGCATASASGSAIRSPTLATA